MSDQSNPVIIEVAINGVTNREQNPRVPITPDEIARDALACIEAGAAVVHNHTTVFGQGPEASADAYRAGWAAVYAARPDALIYPTVDYNEDGVSYEHLAVLASRGALRIGICDPGFLRTVLAFDKKGRVPDGAMLKFYFSTEHGLFGAPFGMPPTIKALEMYLDILGDCPIPWAVSVVGGDAGRSDVAAAALERGGTCMSGWNSSMATASPQMSIWYRKPLPCASTVAAPWPRPARPRRSWDCRCRAARGTELAGQPGAGWQPPCLSSRGDTPGQRPGRARAPRCRRCRRWA